MQCDSGCLGICMTAKCRPAGDCPNFAYLPDTVTFKLRFVCCWGVAFHPPHSGEQN